MKQHVESKVILIVLLILSVSAGQAMAWGGGHDQVQEIMVDHLPSVIAEGASKAALEESITHWSHSPDSFKSFDAEADLIGPNGMATLKRYGVKRRYDLHHDWARPVAWVCLVDALREKRYDAAVFWIACMGHSAADMVASNHHPLAHQATYEWPVLKDVTFEHDAPVSKAAGLLDLRAVTRTALGLEIYAKTFDAMRLSDDGRSASDAMMAIMMYGYEGATYCAQRGLNVVRYAAEYSDGGGEPAERALWQNLSELGAWAAVRVLRDVEVAVRVAATDQTVQIDRAMYDAHQRQVNQWIIHRPLHEEAMFAPLLRPVTAATRQAIGVVMEPTWRFNEGFLGFHARLIAASVARTLSESERRYVTLDVRDLAAKPWPSSDQVPVVIVAASQMRGRYHTIDGKTFGEHMDRYIQSGGKVLWIAGQGALPRPALSPIASMVVDSPQKDWPIDPETFEQWRFGAATGKETWPFVRSPEIGVGWQRPYCAYRFDTDGKAVRRLWELVGPNQKAITVGVMQYADGRPTAACIPIYALHPMLLQYPKILDHAHEPRLDDPGQTILLKTLERLAH
ncbi:hypothetical protein HED60_05355 [Planctomycetales bacterium ZRK34]|nr:hypothetical protein HED60_05355 [Planctomycetales bacterium ZRK34]